MNVCVYGAANDNIDVRYLSEGEKLGKLLACGGHRLVFGAGATGMMGAVAKGVHAGGGKMLGVAPGFFDKPGVLYQQCDEMVFTETMRQRKQIMEDRAESFIMVPGGIGTFEEFFEILTLKQLGQHTKQIIIYDINDFFKPLLAFIQNAIDKDFMAPTCLKLFDYCTSSEQVFEAIENYKHDADEDYIL